MSTKLKSYIFIFIGVSLIVAGYNMKYAKTTRNEETKTEVTVPSTKGKNAAIGAGIGAVGGGILAAFVGGIGIVVAGTGIGLPAGAALIATAAAIGAGGGAISGAALGTSETTILQPSIITYIESTHEPWLWRSIIILGLIFLLTAIWQLKKLRSLRDK